MMIVVKVTCVWKSTRYLVLTWLGNQNLFLFCCVTWASHLTALGFNFLFWKRAVFLFCRTLEEGCTLCRWHPLGYHSTGMMQGSSLKAEMKTKLALLALKPNFANPVKPCIGNHFVRNKQYKNACRCWCGLVDKNRWHTDIHIPV